MVIDSIGNFFKFIRARKSKDVKRGEERHEEREKIQKTGKRRAKKGLPAKNFEKVLSNTFFFFVFVVY